MGGKHPELLKQHILFVLKFMFDMKEGFEMEVFWEKICFFEFQDKGEGGGNGSSVPSSLKDPEITLLSNMFTDSKKGTFPKGMVYIPDQPQPTKPKKQTTNIKQTNKGPPVANGKQSSRFVRRMGACPSSFLALPTVEGGLAQPDVWSGQSP